MKLEEFEQAMRRDDFAVGDSFWLADWEFEVVNRRDGDSLVEDEVVFRWELTKHEFIQLIADNHPEIENPEEFFDQHKDNIIHRFIKGFDVLVGECGATYGSVMNDAVDEAISQNQSPMKTKRLVTVAGKPIIDIYEADNGRCWFVTKRVQEEGHWFLFGYVRCLKASMLAEFHHLPEEALNDTVRHIWKVDRDAWHRCPCVDVKEDTEGPKVVHCDSRDTNAQPWTLCSNS